MALVKSITEKDYPLAQTLVVIYGAIVLLINFIVDVVLRSHRPTIHNSGELS